MTDREGLVRKMVREEWRMHSELYKGRSFAAFPLMIFLFTFLFSWGTTNYSTLGAEPVGTAVVIVAVFLGLGIGNLNYSGRDAWKNVLGKTSYIVYSSRTLPISRRKILSRLVIKELFYYAILFLLPVTAGALLGTNFLILETLALAPLGFMGGIAAGLLLARITISKPSFNPINFQNIESLEPVADKSLMDLTRSSGGIVKVFFSLGLLTAFYWYLVLFFPITQVLLNNPLISYSVMIGLLNLSVYNWINRFDDVEDYLHLPLGRRKVLTGKEEAYMVVAVPMTAALISISWWFYPQNYMIALATGIATTMYNLAVAIYTTGLKPNEKLFNTWTFLKYMLLENIVAGPLLALSIVYQTSREVQALYAIVLIFMVLSSLTYLYYRDEFDRHILTDFMRQQ